MLTNTPRKTISDMQTKKHQPNREFVLLYEYLNNLRGKCASDMKRG